MQSQEFSSVAPAAPPGDYIRGFIYYFVYCVPDKMRGFAVRTLPRGAIRAAGILREVL
ncbi:hypothetical protein ASZ90_010284 [hydrocarbon metagenome]|uniref:Uncharacterized protein n=1 Tax=hydrocarbon metagenome TaxID=938273 RepID=A0A0W8FGH8_9ZZZZ